MPSKQYYLSIRPSLTAFGYQNETDILDIHYKLTLVYNKMGTLIKIL